MRSKAMVIVLALALGVSACGGDDDDSATDAQATTAAGTDTSTEDTSATTTGDSASATTAGGDATATTSDGAGDIEEVDVCAILTADDIASVVGVTPSAAEPDMTIPDVPIFGCNYDVEGGFVQASVTVSATEEEAKELFQFGLENNDYPTVDGVGDEAYDAAPAFGLTARSGRFEVSVNVAGSADDAAAELEQEKELTQLVIDRLP